MLTVLYYAKENMYIYIYIYKGKKEREKVKFKINVTTGCHYLHIDIRLNYPENIIYNTSWKHQANIFLLIKSKALNFGISQDELS